MLFEETIQEMKNFLDYIYFEKIPYQGKVFCEDSFFYISQI